MRQRFTLLGVCLTFVLWAVVLAGAQTNTNLQITNGPTVEHADSNSAVVAWSTNTNASTLLKYGTDPNNLNQTAEAPWGGVTHRVTIHNLQPNTTYYFQVTSGQGQGTGTGATSSVSRFTTANGPASASK
jgi:phosphodiesterase/alkaline phosphatase D-like protein